MAYTRQKTADSNSRLHGHLCFIYSLPVRDFVKDSAKGCWTLKMTGCSITRILVVHFLLSFILRYQNLRRCFFDFFSRKLIVHLTLEIIIVFELSLIHI